MESVVPSVGKPPAPVAQAFVDDEEMTLAAATGLAKLSFTVPSTVYGGAIMAGILYPCDTVAAWIRNCGETYFRLLLSHVVQSFFIIGVHQLDLWGKDAIEGGTDCFQIQDWFFVICLWIFFASILTEIEETVMMVELVLRKIPTVPGTSKCLKYRRGSDGSPLLVSGGMSLARKIVVTVLVLVPKFAIGVCVLYFGGEFLASSGSNTDLILNSLAVVFIIELDELIYNFLTPSDRRRLIESIPPFESNRLNPVWDALLEASMYIKLILSVLLLVYFKMTALVCPQPACTGAIRSCPVI